MDHSSDNDGIARSVKYETCEIPFVLTTFVLFVGISRQYLKDVRTAAKGFIALGLERYHSVCILGFNSPEWFISDISAIFAG